MAAVSRSGDTAKMQSIAKVAGTWGMSRRDAKIQIMTSHLRNNSLPPHPVTGKPSADELAKMSESQFSHGGQQFRLGYSGLLTNHYEISVADNLDGNPLK